jgi:hypothetical protein
MMLNGQCCRLIKECGWKVLVEKFTERLSCFGVRVMGFSILADAIFGLVLTGDMLSCEEVLQ